MRRLTLALFLLLLFTACAAGSNENGSIGSEDEIDEGCPYNGAIVELKYKVEISFEEIINIWSDHGWRTANPEAGGHTIVGMISGSFDESEWITTSAYRTTDMTMISVWVNEEVEQTKHDEQVSKGHYYLDKMQASFDKKYQSDGERTSRINWGCIQD